MPELKYPAPLTPAHWSKHKGMLAKSKPTGIGEALTKLSKAHDDLDLTLFDTGSLTTADAVRRVLDRYENEHKKKFIKAFQEAKSVEDVATTAAASLKKAALVPKSAVEAAAAVAQAASDYAVDLTSFRQGGVTALEKLRDSLAKAEEKDKDDEDDENAPASVIAAKVARKVVTALKQVKGSDDDTEGPPQQFIIGVGKAHCAVYLGTKAGSGQKPLLKKLLADDGGGIKFFTGQCIWEKGAYTFVGDDIPLGGFAKRLQAALLEATTRRLKVRVRRTAGEADEADDLEAPTVPEAPPLPTSGSPSPSDENQRAEQELTQRLKFLAPRLKRLVALPPPTGAIATKAKDDIGLKVAAKDFQAALEIIARLEQLADKLGLNATPETRTPIDPRDQLRKEQLLTQIEQLLRQAKTTADNIPGSPKYKASYLKQHQQLLAEHGQRSLEAATGIVAKTLPNLLRRCQLLKDRLDTAAVDGPQAVTNLDSWGTQELAGLQTSLLPPAASDGKRAAAAPMIRTIQAKLKEAQDLIDKGEFKKANTVSAAVYHLVAGATNAMASYDTDFPAYKVERDKALKALADLRLHKQSAAISAEIARIERELDRIDSVAMSDSGWSKARRAVGMVLAQCVDATGLANRLQAQAGALPGLTLKCAKVGGDVSGATRLAGFAHKLLVDEGCTEDEAVQMAQDVDRYMSAGLSERDALVSARVCKSLVDAKIDPAKARLVGQCMRAGGTATADDAKVVATGLARLSVEALENLLANGIPTECFRGGVTELDPGNMGVVPRGWDSTGKTWDHVPGMFNSDQSKVMIGTMDDGGDRKVPAKGEVAGMFNGVEIAHGTDDLVGHEAGHAFDVSDGDVKNTNAEFRAARLRDIAAGNTVKRKVPAPPTTTPPTLKGQPDDTAKGLFVTRDDYFVVASEAGVDETHATSGSQGDLEAACSEVFAESFAMHFAGNSRWPELEKFWQNNPWGV